MGDEEDERITGDGKNIECEKGAAMSPAIDEQTARIGVDRAEQSPERIEKADDEDGGAEGLEIFWDEPHPEFFAGTDDENGHEQDDEVAFETEKLANLAPEAHKG